MHKYNQHNVNKQCRRIANCGCFHQKTVYFVLHRIQSIFPNLIKTENYSIMKATKLRKKQKSVSAEKAHRTVLHDVLFIVITYFSASRTVHRIKGCISEISLSKNRCCHSAPIPAKIISINIPDTIVDMTAQFAIPCPLKFPVLYGIV